MIRLTDATTLAFTKLRTRKVRTIVTIITASLLFSGLALAAFLAGGVFESARQFTAGNLSERFIANVGFSGDMDFYNNPDIQARANELYPQVIAEKKAAAKQLGITYVPNDEPKPVEENEGGKYLNTASLAAKRAIEEYLAKRPTVLERTKELADTYHPKAYYGMRQASVDGTLIPMKDGREDFTQKVNPLQFNGSSTMDFANGWSYLTTGVVTPFLVEQKYLDAQTNKNDLPIIAPFSKVEEALGLKPVPKNAPADARLKRIDEVRAKAATVTFSVCYRNQASQSQIDSARSTSEEIERNKNNKDYQKPALIYGLPAADACAPATIVSDKRPAEEKKLIEKQLEFSRRFGEAVDPMQQKVTARVVGISPDGFDFGSFSSVDILISMIAGSSLQGQWVVPQELYDALPNKAEYEKFSPKKTMTAPSSMPFISASTQLVEFANADDARNFVTQVGCSGMDCSQTKPYITYFGSNSVLIQDLVKGTATVLSYVGAVIAIIASLILMGMVGRVISDSRRETAVFRAIGARRNDIRAIYVTYTIFLSTLVAVMTLVIGLGVALWINSQLASEATVRAHLTFVGADRAAEFRLFGVWWEALLAIVALIIIAGLVSMLLPIARNLARSPIKDMRDET